jgi:CRISPR-associated protein Cas2
MVLFDLPTETKKDRKIYSDFRKALLKRGFVMFQFSIYLRYCSSVENMNAHILYVKRKMPSKGHIGILMLTDKQFGDMELLYCRKPVSRNVPSYQLELF